MRLAAYEKEREANRSRGITETLTLFTRVPSKWRVVDLETGQIFRSLNGKWAHATDLEVAVRSTKDAPPAVAAVANKVIRQRKPNPKPANTSHLRDPRRPSRSRTR